MDGFDRTGDAARTLTATWISATRGAHRAGQARIGRVDPARAILRRGNGILSPANSCAHTSADVRTAPQGNRAGIFGRLYAIPHALAASGAGNATARRRRIVPHPAPASGLRNFSGRMGIGRAGSPAPRLTPGRAAPVLAVRWGR